VNERCEWTERTASLIRSTLVWMKQIHIYIRHLGGADGVARVE